MFKGIVSAFSYTRIFSCFFVFSDELSWLLFCFSAFLKAPHHHIKSITARAVPLQVQRLKIAVLDQPEGLWGPGPCFQKWLSSWSSYPSPSERPNKFPRPSHHFLLASTKLVLHTSSRRKLGKDQFLFPFPTGLLTSISTSDMLREQWELSSLLPVSQQHTFEPVICTFHFLICQSYCFLLVFLFLQPFLSKGRGTYVELMSSYLSEIRGSA